LISSNYHDLTMMTLKIYQFSVIAKIRNHLHLDNSKMVSFTFLSYFGVAFELSDSWLIL